MRVFDDFVVSEAATVFEHGWQSWSPTTTYPADATSWRPVHPNARVVNYRPGKPQPERGFQGEGLLGVDPGDGGPVRLYAAVDGLTEVPSIQAALVDGRVVVRADGPVEIWSGADLPSVLAVWATEFAKRAASARSELASPAVRASGGTVSARSELASPAVANVEGTVSARSELASPAARASGGAVSARSELASPAARASGGAVGTIRPAPSVWCSWYHYFTDVTEADIVENLSAIGEHELPVDVVQIDDGWQREIGDWLAYSDRFASFPELIRRIRDAGRRAGIWVAPFLASARSDLARAHPDWLTGGAGINWGAEQYGLDPTHPGVHAYLTEVFGSLRELGIDYFKVDFLYAGALDSLAAYRAGVETIRAAIGDAYLLGCGAPILPSVGLFDAMRVSADTAPHYAPPNGDPSQPSQAGAVLSTVARAFQHGRFWVNDPDCLIVRPEVERREEWAAVVERYGGLRASSDRIASLDAWGLATTRRLLSTAPPPEPFAP